MSTGFETSAFKLLISDVGKAKEVLGEEEWELQISAADLGCLRSDKKTKLRIKLIWIQGIVVSTTGNSIKIKDDTGIATIENTNAAPGGDHSGIVIGSYVGIIGQIVAVTPNIVITAVKVMCLKDKPLIMKIWPDEVKTLQAYLLDLLQPTYV